MHREKPKNKAEAAHISDRKIIALVAFSCVILIVSIVSTYTIGRAIQALPTPMSPADSYHQQAAEALYEQNYYDAIRLLTDAIALNPDDARYYDSRAYAYFQTERHEMALRDYKRAIDLDSGEAGRYAARGYLYYAMERYNKAIIDYTVSLALDNDRAQVYKNRADACIHTEDYTCALDDYGTALAMMEAAVTETHPLDESTYMNTLQSRAYVYALRGTARNSPADYSLAIQDYTVLLAMQPDSRNYQENLSVIYTNRGNIRLEKGDTEGAAADYLQATQLNPDFATPWWSLGNLYDNTGDYASARHYYQQYVDMAEDSLSASAQTRIEQLEEWYLPNP